MSKPEPLVIPFDQLKVGEEFLINHPFLIDVGPNQIFWTKVDHEQAKLPLPYLKDTFIRSMDPGMLVAPKWGWLGHRSMPE